VRTTYLKHPKTAQSQTFNASIGHMFIITLSYHNKHIFDDYQQ